MASTASPNARSALTELMEPPTPQNDTNCQVPSGPAMTPSSSSSNSIPHPPPFHYGPYQRIKLRRDIRSRVLYRNVGCYKLHRAVLRYFTMSLHEDPNSCHNHLDAESSLSTKLSSSVPWRKFAASSSLARKSWLREKEEKYGKIGDRSRGTSDEIQLGRGFHPMLNPIPMEVRPPGYQQYCVTQYLTDLQELVAIETGTDSDSDMGDNTIQIRVMQGNRSDPGVGQSSLPPAGNPEDVIDSRLVPVVPRAGEPPDVLGEGEETKNEGTLSQRIRSMFKGTNSIAQTHPSRIPVPISPHRSSSLSQSSRDGTKATSMPPPPKRNKLHKKAPSSRGGSRTIKKNPPATSSRRVLGPEWAPRAYYRGGTAIDPAKLYTQRGGVLKAYLPSKPGQRPGLAPSPGLGPPPRISPPPGLAPPPGLGPPPPPGPLPSTWANLINTTNPQRIQSLSLIPHRIPSNPPPRTHQQPQQRTPHEAFWHQIATITPLPYDPKSASAEELRQLAHARFIEIDKEAAAMAHAEIKRRNEEREAEIEKGNDGYAETEDGARVEVGSGCGHESGDALVEQSGNPRKLRKKSRPSPEVRSGMEWSRNHDMGMGFGSGPSHGRRD
ncbi:uncharacterized protein BDR25DRAFT_365040 [Lindgomyces ingoldianus]|uniref:Uncharacterized protein n=1 Tax=Lindgomyces ingoldianus TaxID=673940 RepID=A0ACB6RFN6_9PLEO|nr:uncharacterized protein BDR25DRAFT_365040 [Lindgomyces ingoldianus]KAF2478021.1 hypothetical protein BDR25DRAFT_365040 [Lindgomyces ingoldianus]